MREMPIYTVYAKIIRHGKKRHRIKNIAIHTFYEVPLGWHDLKEVLLEAARKLYFEYEQATAEISLDQHMPGRYKRATTSYRESRIRYGRQPALTARLTYVKGNNTVKVETVSFLTPEFYFKFKDGYDEEKRRKWQMPKPVPVGFEATLYNPNLLFIELLTQKTPQYAPQPKNQYGSLQAKRRQHGAYAVTAKGLYSGKNAYTVERDKQEKETEIRLPSEGRS